MPRNCAPCLPAYNSAWYAITQNYFRYVHGTWAFETDKKLRELYEIAYDSRENDEERGQLWYFCSEFPSMCFIILTSSAQHLLSVFRLSPQACRIARCNTRRKKEKKKKEKHSWVETASFVNRVVSQQPAPVCIMFASVQKHCNREASLRH